jgi:hypothetical protein
MEEELLAARAGRQQAGRIVEIPARSRDGGRDVVAGLVLVPGDHVRGPQGLHDIKRAVPPARPPSADSARNWWTLL